MNWFSPRAYFHFDFFCKGEEKMSDEQTTTTAAPKKRVADKIFVLVYLSCDTYGDLAEKLELSEGAVRARAATLRKAGVNLVPYKRVNRAGTDVALLNDLIGVREKAPEIE